MTDHQRRDFLRTTSAGLAGAAAVAFPAGAITAAGANQRVRIGMIGCGGRARGLMDWFSTKEADITYVCDPDASRANEAAERVAAASHGGKTPKTVSDFRTVLDDKNVDAVVVATPDHWHAPAAILACQADKHVYVEKPCSHNLREGRLLVDAARKHNRVVQHGTQSRSMPLIVDAMQMLEEGLIGEVLMAKAWNVQRRNNIGHAKPSDPPKNVDYDLWVGPAEFLPYQSNRFHYDWHWWHNFGTGDTGNDGAHELDYARWGLGVDQHPTRVSGLGGKLYFDDDQQYPDSQQVVFEYPNESSSGRSKMLIWEMRIWSTNYPFNIDNGVEFYGTDGRMLLTKRGKLQVFGKGSQRIDAKLKSDRRKTLPHHLDFLDAIHNDRRPNADIEIGHLSASLCHLGNAACRVGRTLEFDPQTEAITNDAEANALLTRKYRAGGHWAVPAGV